MRRNRFTKISWKLALIYSGIFSMVLLLLNIATMGGIHFFLRRQAVDQVKETADLIIERIEELDGYLHELKAKDLVLEIPANDNIYVKIIDHQGKTINESEKYNQQIPENIRVKVNELKICKGLLYQTWKINLRHHKFAYLQVVKTLANENKFTRALLIIDAVAGLLGIVFSLFSGLWISKKMLIPITRITQAAQDISIHNLNRRIDTKGPKDELTILARTFNEMIDRLQYSFQSQNQFVSDASHELRTPIAVIQGYANLLDRWGKNDPGVLQESLNVIEKETAHMGRMIEKMLFLARGDSGAYSLEKEDLHLNAVVDEVVSETRLIAPEYEILSERNDPVCLEGDRRLLKQMLRGLLDNGIKFSPQTKKVCVNLRATEETAVLTVEDFGIGIPPDETDRIFNRFYQADKAGNPGSGLGLAIVKWIVEAHSGKVTVASEVGRGTTFTVEFPIW